VRGGLPQRHGGAAELIEEISFIAFTIIRADRSWKREAKNEKRGTILHHGGAEEARRDRGNVVAGRRFLK
jgi:hypothetical protein